MANENPEPRTANVAPITPPGAAEESYAFDTEASGCHHNCGDGGDGGAVFALAPAGDTWSSGRILEALLRGAIPVVDATYATDGVSDKGCRDAAAFWRDGGPGFAVPAPFVFVTDWADLPAQLVAAGAGDPAKLRERLSEVAAYRAKLEEHLRSSALSAIARQRNRAPETACRTTALDAAAEAALNDAAAAYYADGWYENCAASPAYGGSGCTTAYATDGVRTHGALCFDAACAPPLVADFSCAAISDAA